MKLNKYIYACLAGVILLTSCNEQENKVKYTGPAEVSFKTIQGSGIFGEAPVDGVEKTYNIEIGVTNSLENDRTVTLEVVPPANYKGEYDSSVAYLKGDIVILPNNVTYIANDVISVGTVFALGKVGATWSNAGVAIEGVHYSLTKSVVIPKGKFFGNCVVTPDFSKLVPMFLDINLKIKDVTNAKLASYRTNLTSKLIKYIPFDEAKVLGNYLDSSNNPVSVVKSEKDNEYLLKGYAKTGDIIFKFVHNNPADFHTIILNKEEDGIVWFTHSSYGDIVMYGAGNKGEFSMATPISFSLNFDAGTPTAYFGAQSETFTHQ